MNKIPVLSLFFLIFSTIIYESDCKSLNINPIFNLSGIRSDVIVTTGVKVPQLDVKREISLKTEDEEPGWMRKQLMNFGNVASKIGNSFGKATTKLTSALEKICTVLKTVIPVVAAVCHVGDFQFCAAAEEGPSELANIISSSNLELEIDKR